MANHLDLMKGVYGKAFSAALDFMAIDTCTVYGERTEIDEIGKPSRVGYTLAKDYPCALSFNTSPVSTAAPLPEAEQAITLFLDLGIRPEPGSVFVVTQGMTGRTESYNMAGAAKVYDTHQEIALERTDKKIGETRYVENRDREPDKIS